jgi:hypothetical protein
VVRTLLLVVVGLAALLLSGKVASLGGSGRLSRRGFRTRAADETA